MNRAKKRRFKHMSYDEIPYLFHFFYLHQDTKDLLISTSVSKFSRSKPSGPSSPSPWVSVSANTAASCTFMAASASPSPNASIHTGTTVGDSALFSYQKPTTQFPRPLLWRAFVFSLVANMILPRPESHWHG